MIEDQRKKWTTEILTDISHCIKIPNILSLHFPINNKIGNKLIMAMNYKRILCIRQAAD